MNDLLASLKEIKSQLNWELKANGSGVAKETALYELLSGESAEVLGAGCDLRSCFEFVNSKAGERAMGAARLNQAHRDMLVYFASMMLDPDGHRRWMDEIRDELKR
ncbi:MAG: hypothetical protein AAGA95_18995 [Pseudomonadota bacterium]